MPASPRVQHSIERLCEQGCNAVRHAITALAAGLPVNETRDLSVDERAAVLRELIEIMRVYDQPKDD